MFWWCDEIFFCIIGFDYRVSIARKKLFLHPCFSDAAHACEFTVINFQEFITNNPRVLWHINVSHWLLQNCRLLLSRNYTHNYDIPGNSSLPTINKPQLQKIIFVFSKILNCLSLSRTLLGRRLKKVGNYNLLLWIFFCLSKNAQQFSVARPNKSEVRPRLKIASCRFLFSHCLNSMWSREWKDMANTCKQNWFCGS